MKLYDVAIYRDDIVSQNIECPLCGEIQYSVFDKLFTKAYDQCVNCTDAEKLEPLGENIFSIINS